jgi:hypothetical protein
MIILTEPALIAARQWAERAGLNLSVPMMHGLIEAALPHLAIEPSADGEPVAERGIDGRWLADRLDKVDEALADLRRDDVAWMQEVADAYRKGKAVSLPAETERERNSERAHRERMVKHSVDEAYLRGVADARAAPAPTAPDVRVDAAYLRGQKMGMEVARAHGEGGPTDYEAWRDALQMTASREAGTDWSSKTMRDTAGWFHTELLRGAPPPEEPEVPDCEHCGADSSMDHNDDCPNNIENISDDRVVQESPPCTAVPDTAPGRATLVRLLDEIDLLIRGRVTVKVLPLIGPLGYARGIAKGLTDPDGPVCLHCGADSGAAESHDAGCPNEPNGE